MSVSRIRVGAKSPTAADVLEYARELIATFGWNPGFRAVDTGEAVGQESSEEAGYTLHDSIGEACTRLSQATGVSASKDWAITDMEGTARNLRAEAVGLVQAELPDGLDDKTFNDKAAGVDEVYAVLDAALAKAQEGATV